MKVSTDACILGAFTPATAKGRMLDIGTGSGLLSLMLAQRCNSLIDAAELDEPSFQQAADNVANSKWKDRIRVIHTDIRMYHASPKYALIICNPPFYENHFQSPSLKKNKAKHALQLSYQELLEVVKRNLEPDGIFSVLLPSNSAERFMQLAGGVALQACKRMLIKERDHHPVKRQIILFSTNLDLPLTETTLTIRDTDGHYSTEFRQLLHPYYLHL